MREMKDSRSKWIGEIPSHWTIAKVKHFFYRSKEEAHQDNPIVLSLARSGVKIRDLSKNEGQLAESYYNYNPVKPGDLLLNPMDLYSGANCSISKVSGVISPAYMNLRNWGTADPMYYDYYFKTQYWSMAFFAHGEGVSFDNRWTLNAEGLFNYPIPVPPLSEQHRIADFLDRKCADIDNVIEKTKASIEEYKRLKQSVITEAVTKGIRGERSMKDSGCEWFGEIPDIWQKSRVGLHHNIILGKMLCSEPKGEDYSLEKYFCAADVHFDGIAKNDYKSMWFSDTEKELYRVRQDDLLIVEGGAGAGGCAIVGYLAEPFYIQNSIMIVRPRSGSSSRYLRYYIESIVKRGYIDIACNKATIPHFTKDKLGNVPIPLPPLEEQQEIAEYLDKKCSEIDSLIASKEKFISELESYKKSLIYEYVTGKKEVPEA